MIPASIFSAHYCALPLLNYLQIWSEYTKATSSNLLPHALAAVVQTRVKGQKLQKTAHFELIYLYIHQVPDGGKDDCLRWLR